VLFVTVAAVLIRPAPPAASFASNNGVFVDQDLVGGPAAAGAAGGDTSFGDRRRRSLPARCVAEGGPEPAGAAGVPFEGGPAELVLILTPRPALTL